MELLSEDSKAIWSYNFSTSEQQPHHDIYSLPNGNLLIIMWELIPRNTAITNGMNPDFLETDLWSEKIIEIKPIGTDQFETIWEWHLWDHLVQDFDSEKVNFGNVKNSSNKIDINTMEFGSQEDWIHMNALDYNEELDQILLSSPFLNEIWIIDHSTTSEQAATGTGGLANMGGDILFRWGNPELYDSGTDADRKLYGQHNPHWVDNSSKESAIIVFNNGHQVLRDYSTIDLITPVINEDGAYGKNEFGQFLPEQVEIIYGGEENKEFFSFFVSGVQPLGDDSYLICEGAEGRFFEIDENKDIQWEFINPINGDGINCSSEVSSIKLNTVFRIEMYAEDYSGLPLEFNRNKTFDDLSCPLYVDQSSNAIYPNPFDNLLTFSFTSEVKAITLYGLNGERIAISNQISNYSSFSLDTSSLESGLYIAQIEDLNGTISSKKIIKN